MTYLRNNIGRLLSLRKILILTLCATSLVIFLSLARPNNSYRIPDRGVLMRNVLGTFDDDTFEPNENGVCTGQRWPVGSTPLYIITPTYPRAEQIPELTRLGQTLLLVDSLVWIVAEDALKESESVKDYLRESGHCYVYLKAPMPAKYKKNKVKPRGVANRNAGLKWIYAHAKSGGVAYFADDDNTYDRRLFEEIRTTKKVSMFPVGLVTSLHLSTPIIRDNKVVDFYDGWLAGRKFPVDMAGFAFNVDYLLSLNKTIVMPFSPGREETKFLEQLEIQNSDIEPLADNCQKILVWHTKTQNKGTASLKTDIKFKDSNVDRLRKQLWVGLPTSAPPKQKSAEKKKKS